MNAPVLKTDVGVSPPGVRIPPPPHKRTVTLRKSMSYDFQKCYCAKSVPLFVNIWSLLSPKSGVNFQTHKKHLQLDKSSNIDLKKIMIIVEIGQLYIINHLTMRYHRQNVVGFN